MFKGVRRLTPEIVKNSKYDFNIMWNSSQFIFIKLTEKKTNVFDSSSDYDKGSSPTLIPPLLISNKEECKIKKQNNKVFPNDGLSLLERYL